MPLRAGQREGSEGVRGHERPPEWDHSRAIGLSAALLLLLTAAPPGELAIAPEAAAGGGTIQIMGATLRFASFGTSAVWNGTHAYVFGARDATGNPSLIVRYDPSNDTVTVMGTRLSPAREYAAAVWAGDAAYLFGGVNGSVYLDEVLRYDPATDTVAVKGALPSPRTLMSAVWDGNDAYLFGGHDGIRSLNQVVQYSPADDTIAVVASLPRATMGSAAVWDGSAAYIFGGCDGCSGTSDILRFDPSTNTVSELTARLPVATRRMSAVFSGTSAYVFGGDGHDEIQRFRPSDSSVLLMDVRLPSWRSDTSAVYDGDHVFIFGGWAGTSSTEIVRYVPNLRPVAVIAPIAPAECVDGRGVVRLDGTGSFDPDGDAVSYLWSSPNVAFDEPASPTSTASFPLGASTVQLVVGDGDLVGSARAEVSVVDTLPPEVRVARPAAGGAYVMNLVALGHGQALPGFAVGPLTARAEVLDQCGVVNVRFRASDGEEGLDAEPEGHNYTFRLDPSVPFAGEMTLNATALDLGWNTNTSSITYLHIGTTACPLVFGGGDECSVGGVQPPVGPGLPGPETPLPLLEEACRLLVGSAVCRDVLGG